MPPEFNVTVLVNVPGDNPRTIEKLLVIRVKDKNDFNLTLSNNNVSMSIGQRTCH
jgi:hypothetical protein